ncbi:FkbM family methyltransferase [Actinoplanes sp. NPDC051470]|uniref:FkbM family methyltransferase n=1 Tax=Actinoplanes sp. NPDC051470 TaxID=3157224 RepID=UPI003437CFD4
MLVRNLLSQVKGVTGVVDATAGAEDLRRHLMVPDDLPFSADVADATPDSLLVCMLGPQGGTHTAPEDLARTLRAVPAGVTVLILAGWPPDAFPDNVALATLADGHCQLTDAVTLTSTGRYGMHVALLAERVETVRPRRAQLSAVPDAEPPTLPDGSLATRLWLVNQPVLAERTTGPLRRQVRALTDRVTQLSAELTDAQKDTGEARAELKARGKELARAEKRITALERSVSFRLGKTLVDGARHPGKGVLAVPMTVASIWRDRRARVSVVAAPRPEPATPPVEATHRAVPIPVPGSPGRVVTMTAPSALMVPRYLDQDGLAGYEPTSIPCFLAAIETAGPGAVLDIGANVGLYAALAAAVSDRDVVAFEPFPTLAEVAERLTADNDLKIQVERIALSDHIGTAAFYLSDSSDSSNSLAAGFRDSTRQIDVAVETLDAYVRRTGIVPAVLKIDTESTEPDVLLGAAETLREHRPWVLCEVLHRRGEDRLMEAMAPHGYRWYHITDRLPYAEAQVIAGDRTYQDLMWLFAPEEPDDSFWARVAAQRTAVEKTRG